VLLDGFRERDQVRVFPEGWGQEAAAFAPHSIAGTLEQIEALPGIRVTHALVVFRRTWEPRLIEPERERLWRAFGVPAFEQLIAEDCTLLASECEAHDGLHIESPKFVAGDQELDRSPCGCGRTAPRLLGIDQLRRVATSSR